MSVERSEFGVERSGAAGRAVFLSYASQDAEAAKRIADALRVSGVEVWFDAEGGLETGDEWDAKIRRQIKECVLFLPIVSANTQAREEGYFRIEWDLAAERARGIASGVAFILPIVIDDTREADALVPDRFRTVQWTKLPGGEVTPEVKARFLKLWSHRAGVAKQAAAAGRDRLIPPREEAGFGDPALQSKRRSLWPWVALGLAAVVAAYLIFKPRRSPEEIARLVADAQKVAAPAASPATPAPNPESRQLVLRAKAMLDRMDSTADDFAAAESLAKRALELEPTDGEAWAVASRINSAYLTRGFERSDVRRTAALTQAERAVKLAPESPEAWLALGRANFHSNFARADEAIQHGLKLAPNDGRLLLALAGSYRRQDRYDEAMALYQRAAEQPEVRPLALYDQYLIHFYYGRFAEAERSIRDAIALAPTSNMVAGHAMLEVTWRGNVAEARKLLATAPAEIRNQPRLVYTSALVALMAHESHDALRALDQQPADYINDAWFTGPKGLLVGLAHSQLGNKEAARLAWESGLAVAQRRLGEAPNDPEAHLRRGELLGWLGRTEEALQEARVFNELRRRRSTDWTDSPARIYAAIGRADLAVSELTGLVGAPPSGGRWPLTPALLRLDPIWEKLRDDVRFQRLIIANTPPRDWPRNPELKRAVGLLDGLQMIPEDLRLAEEIAQRELDRNPTDPEAVTAMARVHSMWLLRGWDRSTARYQKAKATAERALQLAPGEPEAHAALSIHLYARGAEIQRALESAQRAVDLCPQEPRFHRMRDNCLWNLYIPNGSVFSDQSTEQVNEGLKKALGFARRTVELFPQDPLVRYELSRHYRDVGMWSDFERVNEEVLALAPLANALVWKARGRFGLHGDLPGMKAVLDQVPARVRGIERTVFAYFLYASFTGRAGEGLEALNSLTETWMIDFDYRGPKALLAGSLLDQADKKELARVQYDLALQELLRGRSRNPEDAQTFMNEAWIKFGLGRADEARAALHIHLETLERPYAISPMSTWWFQSIPAYLLMGERATALQLIREAATSRADGRDTLRKRLALDPRLVAFRDDPEIAALLAEPEVKK